MNRKSLNLKRAIFLLSTAAITLSACAAANSPTSTSVRSQAVGASSNHNYNPVPYPMASGTPAPGQAYPMTAPSAAASGMPMADANQPVASNQPVSNTEDYNRIYENPFLAALKNPLSTFSIDVDTASYSNVRRFLNQGQLPQPDAVRIEEMLNYFRYDYPKPEADKPFAVSTELSECPWAPEHKLLQIGMQAKQVDMLQAPRSNLVFLIDVSGSMSGPERLGLVKQSLRLLVDQMRENDRISIVVYAGAAGLVLPSTTGDKKETILAALDKLEAGGSTAGGAGIQLAYKAARENFIIGGNNRVILASDGDFNVGVSSDGELQRLVEDKRKEGVFLTVLGYGMGNLKDNKLEVLANKGNGNYAYIDSLAEARKVLVTEMGGTLLTVAKDVKLQLEFNPAKVESYRLIGYENRLLAAEDFDNDAKDAGELGAGHTVTALYEIVPAKAGQSTSQNLTYTETQIKEGAAGSSDLLTLKLRYKQPTSDTSELISQTVADSNMAWSEASPNLHFAASVAGFGMLLRNSEHKGNLNFNQVLTLGQQGLGPDREGYRAAYLQMVQKAMGLNKSY